MPRNVIYQSVINLIIDVIGIPYSIGIDWSCKMETLKESIEQNPLTKRDKTPTKSEEVWIKVAVIN